MISFSILVPLITHSAVSRSSLLGSIWVCGCVIGSPSLRCVSAILQNWQKSTLPIWSFSKDCHGPFSSASLSLFNVFSPPSSSPSLPSLSLSSLPYLSIVPPPLPSSLFPPSPPPSDLEALKGSNTQRPQRSNAWLCRAEEEND